MSCNSTKSAMQIVEDMGIGYNLGNMFDCYNDSIQIKTPKEQITSCGNPEINREMIVKIRKSGFKTIRFPITWINFIDDLGNINEEWMSKVKEVVDWIINANMYCILNIYHDGDSGNWLTNGKNAREKYINLWRQIAIKFRIYDEHLIFESMNSYINNINNLNTQFQKTDIYTLNQAFVDTVRKEGENNKKRLLLIYGDFYISGYNYLSKYIIPEDASNKLALSVHFFYPVEFALIHDGTNLTFEGAPFALLSKREWGSYSDYNNLINQFHSLNNFIDDKRIPIIIVEFGVLTEDKKEKESIREYLNAILSFANDYKGIAPCLWDTSDKKLGEYNYFNREKKEWYDEQIKNIIKNISKGKYPKPKEYFFYKNEQTAKKDGNEEFLIIYLRPQKVLKFKFNLKITIPSNTKILFNLETIDSKGAMQVKKIEGKKKKEYDGTYTITVEDDYDYNEIIRIEEVNRGKNIILNYITVEYKENYLSFEYNLYKSDIYKYIENH